MWTRVLAELASRMLSVAQTFLKCVSRLLFNPLPSEGDFHTIRHIVIYRVGNIGDIVVAIPAMAAIRATFPQATISLLTSSGRSDLPSATDVLQPLNPLCDRIIQYLPAEMKRGDTRDVLKKKLHEAGPIDLMIVLPVTMQTCQRSLQEMLLARWLGSRHAIGFTLLLPECFRTAYCQRFPERILKTSDWLCSLLPFNAMTQENHHGSDRKPSRQWPVVSHDDNAWRSFWDVYQLNPVQPILAVNAGAKLDIKRWPAASFQEALQHIRLLYPTLQIVLLGQSSEHALNAEISQHIEGPILNAAGQFDFAQTWLLLSRATVVLSNDTGPMHMASLLGKPVITPMPGQFPAPLWHPVDGVFQEDRTSHFIPLRHALSCAPCFYEQCPVPQQPCLTQIPAAAVANAVIEQLKAVL